MYIDLSLYENLLPRIKTMHAEHNTDSSLHELINRITGATGMPVLASAIMISPLIGFTGELVGIINRFQAFYNYDSIRGLVSYKSIAGYPDVLVKLEDV